MDYLYSLYAALVGIHIPNDKARAVVDAMERDMGTTIATKSDLQLLRQELVATMGNLSTTMTVRLGSMLIVGLSVLFTALKLTG